jgi:class 3 adenylate cyclase
MLLLLIRLFLFLLAACVLGVADVLENHLLHAAPQNTSQPITQSTFDSLQRLAATASESRKASLLNELSGELEATMPQRAAEVAREALRYAQKNSDRYEETLAHLHLSDALRHLGENAPALRETQIAVAFARSLRSHPDQARLLAKTLSKAAISYRASAQYDTMLTYSQEALALYTSLGDRSESAFILATLCYVYWNIGRYAQGLEYGLKALRVYEELHNERQIARTLNLVGLIYRTLGDNAKALASFQQCYTIRQRLGDKEGAGIALNNLGYVYKNMGQYDTALRYFEQYLRITEELHIKQGRAIASLNIGAVFRAKGRAEAALKAHETSLALNAELGDKRGIANAMSEIGADYRALGRYREAISSLQSAIAAADSIKAKNIVKDSYGELAQAFAALGDFQRAYSTSMTYNALKDTLINDNRDQIIAVQNRHEHERNERERQMQDERIKQQNLMLNVLLGTLFLVMILAFLMLRLYRKRKRAEEELREKNNIIEQEREELEVINQELDGERAKSERLLLNVLPASIADRLKSGEMTIAERFDEVSVLFADLVNFTPLSINLPPEKVVSLLNNIFTRFDALAADYGLEKIKTIGDAYMVVGGVPTACPDHCERIASFALDIQHSLRELNLNEDDPDVKVILRIGIHTGAAVAGVIGTSKFAYDLWGDTVNTASRMESHGEEGRIHVTEAVYEALQQKFIFEERGEIEVKGKGFMHTYFLVGKTER